MKLESLKIEVKTEIITISKKTITFEIIDPKIILALLFFVLVLTVFLFDFSSRMNVYVYDIYFFWRGYFDKII
mgnify:CR=1 FL=1